MLENQAIIHTVQILGVGVAMSNLGRRDQRYGRLQKAPSNGTKKPMPFSPPFPPKSKTLFRAICNCRCARRPAATSRRCTPKPDKSNKRKANSALPSSSSSRWAKKDGAASALENLSSIYDVQGELEKSKNYTLQARQIFHQHAKSTFGGQHWPVVEQSGAA